MKQHTIQKEIKISDIGLHSGQDIALTLRPAPAHHGIVFKRTDITDRDNLIPALWDKVVDTRMCTVIGNADGVTVATIEHLMSALSGLKIDNLLIELDAAEVPAMDGSAMPFVELIEAAGLCEQDAPRRAIRVLKDIRVEDQGKIVTLTPSEHSVFSGEIDFEHPEIGRQHFATQLINGDFRHDIASARTFGFEHEVEMLRKNGLALGGSLDNAIVLNREGVMNPDGLRFGDEFIRHKLLDAIGDLYLAGGPVLGAYEGVKAGHAMNNAVLRALFAAPEAWEYVEMTESGAPLPVLCASVAPLENAVEH